MARNQLLTVLRVEEDKEQQAAQAFFQADKFAREQKQKLAELQRYKAEYLMQIRQSGAGGVDATRYQQYLSFVSKLDLACEQQTHALSRARMVADQRKSAWLRQQQRKQAIEKLLEKQAKKMQVKQNRIEQAEMDEFANQQLYRASHSF